MRRWNGWGDDAIVAPVSPGLAAALEAGLGPGHAPQDRTFSDLVARAPASRLAPHPLISDDPVDRLTHARGQSFPDLVAIRSGLDLRFPDAVAYPRTAAEVRELLTLAGERELALIPYGGGTSVVGHVNVVQSARSVLTVDLSKIDFLFDLDDVSRLARFGAGISGRRLEAALAPHGFTLGHFPQSFEYSTLGGWIATRSRGQQSIFYGGIDALLAGAVVESPAGTLALPPMVASATGPDLRQLLLGSEGRLGIVTEATVRISRRPTGERFEAYVFPDFQTAVDTVRGLAQARTGVSMLRLSDPAETQLNLGADAPGTVGCCLLLVGVTEHSPRDAIGAAVASSMEAAGATRLPYDGYGSRWAATRFFAPYLRNSLWERGYAVDTIETATDWGQVSATRSLVEAALRSGLESAGERVLAFSHLSHIYPAGSSIYTTFGFRLAADPAETVQRWRILKDAASRAVVEQGATISHQHGIGLDHRPYLQAEKGPLGMRLLGTVVSALDPQRLLNPGKLVD